MVASTQLRVLSLNTYVMGHITYHDMLERTFKEQMPEIAFQGVKLNGYPLSLSSRAIYKLLTLPVPLLSQSKWDFMRLRLELASSLLARKCLDQLLRETTPDVLHIHTQAIALLSTEIMKRIPTVVNIDYTTALLSKEHPAPAQITYRPIVELEHRCFALATHILTWNERARDSVIKDYGVAPDKVTTVHPCVPMDLFLSIERSGRSLAHKPKLLFVGNDFARKGGEDLLAVYRDELSTVCELDVVTNAAVALESTPELRLHRGLSPLSADLIDLYRKADIFVLPTHEDVFPMVFVEAMAAALPCVGTGVMAVPELVRAGSTGLVVEPGNKVALSGALHTLIADESLRLAMGKNGRALAKDEFDNLLNCRRIAEIFQRCVA
jgi:glycosyltransferase involved in cell wall biosynthesis